MRFSAVTFLRGMTLPLVLLSVLCGAAERSQVELQREAETQLYVQTDPAGARVNIDQRWEGESPHLFQLDLPEGVERVVVEIEKEGYQSQTERITIRGGRVTRVKFELKPAPGIDTTATDSTLEAMREAELPSPMAQTARLLDVDTGQWETREQFGEDDRETHDWIRRTEVDLLGVVERNVPGVLFFDAAVIPVSEESWDTITAAEIVSHQQLNQQEPAKITPLISMSAAGQDPKQKPTAVFQTREGTYGILQVLGATEPPSAVRVRYRIVSAVAARSPGESGRTSRLDFRLAPAQSKLASDPAIVVLTEEEINSYRTKFVDVRAPAGNEGEQAFRWFPVRGEISQELITHDVDGQTYVLLSNRPEQVMLSFENGKQVWGLQSVTSSFDAQGTPTVSGEFDNAGARRIAEFSEKLVLNYVAVLVDDEVVMAPKIHSPFSRRFVIQGRFDRKEVDRLVRSLLAGMVQPNSQADRRSLDAVRTMIRLLDMAVQRYRLDMGTWPTTEQGLAALLAAPEGASAAELWNGPYLREMPPVDPWGNPFRYRVPGIHQENGFDLWSLGPDGQDGTADDIGNWPESAR